MLITGLGSLKDTQMENNNGANFFKKSKVSKTLLEEPQNEPARKLKFSDSPYEVAFKKESRIPGMISPESEGHSIQGSPSLYSSSRKLTFDLETDKENIDPQFIKRKAMNNIMVSRASKGKSNELLEALSLKRNFTDAPIDEERNQNADNNELYFFSQDGPLRKGSITDFASFKLTKLKSDHSERSSGNSEYYSPVFPSFEENKPCFLTFATSQPNPEIQDENTETKFDSRDVDSTKETSDCNSDIPEPYIPLLQVVKNLKNPDLFHITPDTLWQLDASNKPYMIVDCRYDYEYNGGHIPGAINIRCPEILERVFFTNRQLLHNSSYLNCLKMDFENVISQIQGFEQFDQNYPQDQETPVIVFHCEFSQKRGPRALRALRNMDREINQSKWPYIFYPEVYILEGGYRNFHGSFGETCVPKNGYVEMIDKTMKKEYVVNKDFEKKHWDKKKTNLPGLHRSKTICDF